jgi:hypothetical protein
LQCLLAVRDLEEAFTNCPKCMTRSNMWASDAWPDHSNSPTHAELIVAHSKLKLSVATMQAFVDK